MLEKIRVGQTKIIFLIISSTGQDQSSLGDIHLSVIWAAGRLSINNFLFLYLLCN